MLDYQRIESYRENNRIEAKLAAGGLPKSLWETYSAFANTIGGVILLGVEELPDHSLRVAGLKDPEGYVAQMQAILADPQQISVNLLEAQHFSIHSSGELRYLAVEVPRAPRQFRPVYLGRDPFRGAYRRNGEGDYHCTEEEVRAMLADAGDVSLDLRPVEQLSPAALCPETVTAYLARVRAAHLEWIGDSDEALLRRLGILVYGPDGAPHPTAAALLLLGQLREIRVCFPNYTLDYREHQLKPGKWAYRLHTGEGDWSGNLFDFYFTVHNRLLTNAESDLATALEEGLNNALLHADYQAHRGLVVEREAESVVYRNPGCLRVDTESGISDPRNAELTRLLRLIGIGQRTGGLRQVRALFAQRKWAAPQLREQFNPDEVTLCLRLHSSARRDAETAQILDYLTEHITASTDELSRQLGIGLRRTQTLLRELRQEQLIVSDLHAGTHRLPR